MVIISLPAVDDADPLAAANGARAPRPEPAANNFDPAAALPPFDDVVHGNGTATTADVGAGTTPWWGWSSPPPYYAGSDAYASSSFPPPPLQSHGDDLACYAGSVMDTSFPPQLPAPPAVYTQPELSYFYYPQEPQQGFPSCFAAPLALEPTATRPQLQVPPPTQPASTPPSLLYYQQTQAATPTGSALTVEEASPALADTQQAQEDGDTRPAPRRRGRPCKRALAVSEPPPVSKKPTKRVAVGSNRAASSTSQRTSSAATGSATMSSSDAGQAVPDQAGASSSSTGSTSGQETAACTGTNSPMAAALLREERCQPQRPTLSSNGAPAGVVAEGHHQEAAMIAPPEAMTETGPPRYADTSAVGVRFRPTDQELLGYLRTKYSRQQMPVEFFRDFDVYHAHPMAITGACGESQDGCWYAFSTRDRRYKNGERPARSVSVKEDGGGGGGEPVQVGFWKSNSKLGDVREGGKKDGAVIGRMTSLTFQVGRQPRGEQTGWKMKEYTIPENQHEPDGSDMLLNDWVVCKLFYKERSTRTNTKSKTDENATSVAVGQEQPIMHRKRKSEKDKDAVSVGHKRPRRSRKSKKDKNATSVAVEQGDGLGEAAAGDTVQGEEDMQPQMVPAAAHQASDYSEQDLCVEDYLVCDVAFAQQNDATANCTI